MNYNDMPHYEAETFIKNRLDTPLKPSLGINPGRNAPLIRFFHDFGEKLISFLRYRLIRNDTICSI